MDRLNLIMLAPEATVSVQGSERRYENGVAGEGVTDARTLWLKLRQRTAYTPQLQALPWAFVQNSTLEQQQLSLQLHAEKKAIAGFCCWSWEGGRLGKPPLATLRW